MAAAQARGALRYCAGRRAWRTTLLVWCAVADELVLRAADIAEQLQRIA
jgi:hypothetical protein